MTQKQKTHRLAVAAMLTAVAAVLQFVEFAIPLMPSFIKLDISDLPALLGTSPWAPCTAWPSSWQKICCICPSAPAPV